MENEIKKEEAQKLEGGKPEAQKQETQKHNMSKSGYFDVELKTSLLFAVCGAIVGYLSFLINHTAGAGLFAIIIFLGLYYAAKKILNIKEEKKWWGTMVLLYFVIWLVVWTIFYNMIVM